MAYPHGSKYMNFYEELPKAEELEAESDDDGAESALEDTEISFEHKSDDEPEEASEEETNDEEAKSEDDDKETGVEKTKVEKPAAKDAKSDEEKTKAFNREQAEKRLQEKQAKELSRKKDQDDYIATADPDDPKDLAVRQLQVDAYTNKVTANQNTLTSAYQRALKDFDILNNPDPAIQAKVNRALDLFQAASVTVDKYGEPVDVRGDLYSHLQTEADSIAELMSIGARKQTTSKEKEKSKTLTPPNRAPKEAKKTAIAQMMEGFDEEAAR